MMSGQYIFIFIRDDIAHGRARLTPILHRIDTLKA